MGRRRVLLVDDNHDFLEGIVAWFSEHPQLAVVGVAHSGHEAFDKVEQLRPDVVVVDVTLPDLNGFEVTRRLKARADAPRVVLATFHDSRAIRREADAAQADACIPKDDLTDLAPLVASLFGESTSRSADAAVNEKRPEARTGGRDRRVGGEAHERPAQGQED